MILLSHVQKNMHIPRKTTMVWDQKCRTHANHGLKINDFEISAAQSDIDSKVIYLLFFFEYVYFAYLWYQNHCFFWEYTGIVCLWWHHPCFLSFFSYLRFFGEVQMHKTSKGSKNHVRNGESTIRTGILTPLECMSPWQHFVISCS